MLSYVLSCFFVVKNETILLYTGWWGVNKLLHVSFGLQQKTSHSIENGKLSKGYSIR